MMKRNRLKTILICLITIAIATSFGAFFKLQKGKEDKQDSSTEVYSDEITQKDDNDDSSTGFIGSADVEMWGTNYHYEQLNYDEKRNYRRIYNAAINYESEVKLEPVSISDFNRIWTAFSYDHPEFYWITGQYMSDGVRVFDLVIDVPEDAQEVYEQINSEVDRIVELAPNDPYEKVKFFYEYIINNTDYVEGSENNQDLRSVFLTHQSICHGYSCAFEYLCERGAIPCGMVSGDIIDGLSHSWNFVQLDGKYYWVDTTWGDNTNYQPEEYSPEPVNYDFLCCSDTPFLNNRILFTDESCSLYEEGIMFDYPTCSDDSLNYYFKSGKYMEVYDADSLVSMFAEQMAMNGASTATVKFSNIDDMNHAIDDLFNRGSESLYPQVIQRVRDVYGKQIEVAGEWHTSDTYSRLTIYFSN